MQEYKHTKGWFNVSEIKRALLNHVSKDQKNNILEIGCYEGLSACFFSDNIMDNEDSSLDCVDPYFPSHGNGLSEALNSSTVHTNTGLGRSGTPVTGISSTCVSGITEENFHHNISKSKNSSKITVHKMTSDDFFKTNKEIYNFIYIDGCHEPEFVTRDVKNGWNVLDAGGIMWMDDYKGNCNLGKDKIKRHIDKALSKFEGGFERIHQGYQLAVKKI